MACTTILVGKKASYDGSTIIARNDDSGSGHYMPKKFVVVEPEEQPKTYRSVLAHLEIPLPEEAMRYTSMPNAVDGEGIWAASGGILLLGRVLLFGLLGINHSSGCQHQRRHHHNRLFHSFKI